MDKVTKPNPSCPYCGSEMDHWYSLAIGRQHYVCPECYASSPAKGDELEAYTAAMQRWQEPNRVLTLEEIISKVSDAVGGVPVWVEQQELGWAWAGWQVLRGTERCVLMFGPTVGIADTQNINRTWRCWLRKPTQEEMEDTPWETK